MEVCFLFFYRWVTHGSAIEVSNRGTTSTCQNKCNGENRKNHARYLFLFTTSMGTRVHRSSPSKSHRTKTRKLTHPALQIKPGGLTKQNRHQRVMTYPQHAETNAMVTTKGNTQHVESSAMVTTTRIMQDTYFCSQYRKEK